MWIAEQGRRRPQTDGTALVGQVTLPGDPAAVYLDGERRELPVYGPGGYIWRPAKEQQVLVLKTGAAGALCGDDREVSPGEVVIYSGGSTIRLNGGNVSISGGVVNLTGQVLVNGKIVVTEG